MGKESKGTQVAQQHLSCSRGPFQSLWGDRHRQPFLFSSLPPFFSAVSSLSPLFSSKDLL